MNRIVIDGMDVTPRCARCGGQNLIFEGGKIDSSGTSGGAIRCQSCGHRSDGKEPPKRAHDPDAGYAREHVNAASPPPVDRLLAVDTILAEVRHWIVAQEVDGRTGAQQMRLDRTDGHVVRIAGMVLLLAKLRALQAEGGA